MSCEDLAVVLAEASYFGVYISNSLVLVVLETLAFGTPLAHQ